MIYRCAVSLSEQLNDEERAQQLLYPKIERIRDISASLARDVIIQALADGLVNEPWILKLYGTRAGVHYQATDARKATQLLHWVRSKMYTPGYENEN
ncbi:hypothetical protein HDU98_004701 [Podochytrium sp. JEL0797]|nr:hypothetical protein HDU98_004701 [Podochytrium sp. JEL0797]